MIKKHLKILKTKKFFNKYPLVIVLQHNNLSVKEWSLFRITLNQLKDVNLLVLKNNITNIILPEKMSDAKNENKSIFQGPSLIIGCLQISQLSQIFQICEKNSKLIVLGAIYNNQLITHLDLKKLLTLEKSIYPLFLKNINISTKLYISLKNSVNLQLFQQPSYNLLYCLFCLKITKILLGENREHVINNRGIS